MKSSITRERASIKELLFLVFSLLIIPSLFVYEVFSFFDHGKTLNETYLIEQNLQKISQSAENTLDEKLFWDNYFTDSFNQSEKINDFVRTIEQMGTLTSKKFDFAIWNNNGKLLKSNIREIIQKKGNWKWIYQDLNHVYRSNEKHRESLSRLRTIIGQQLCLDANNAGKNFIVPKIRCFDVNKEKPNVWLGKNEVGTGLILLYGDLFDDQAGLRFFLRNWQKNLGSYAIFSGEKLKASSGICDETTLKAALYRLKKGSADQILKMDNQFFILKNFSIDRSIIVGSHKLSSSHAGKNALLFLIVAFFLLGIMIKGNFSYLTTPRNYSVKIQIFVMLFISTGLPVLFLTLPTIQYFGEKRVAMLSEKNQELINFVQNIDRSSQNEISRTLHQLERSHSALRNVVSGNFKASDISNIFIKFLGEENFGTLLFSDRRTSNLYTKYCYLEDDKIHQTFDQWRGGDFNEFHLKIFHNIGKCALAMESKGKYKYEPPVETALIFEMFFQKTMNMFLYDLFSSRGEISEISWVENPVMIYTNSLSYAKEMQTGGFLIVLFVIEKFQQSFLERNFAQIVRNPENFKFFAQVQDRYFPEQFSDMPEKKKMLESISLYPDTRPTILDFRRSPHLFVGLRGHFLSKATLIGLYPINKIDEQIAAEKKGFVLITGVGLAIIMALAMLFNYSLLFPIGQLHKATYSLEKRDFSFRIGKISNDEFGEMGKILDTTIADFAELSMASLVQTRLFPNGSMDGNSFQVFGKSIPMNDLGGDYFDYFKADEQSLCMLLGDVAGHGVGASLIMAMAKAGIMYSAEKHKNPAELLSGLHKMIHKTRSKTQRKIMTFQYLCVNIEDGSALYSNAGGCSPILVDASAKTAEEITLQAPVLGGFKNSSFSNLEIMIKPKQAVVFYTDGIVESRNNEDQEFGYDYLKKVLIQCWDNDAERYYENICREYFKWLGSAGAQDDMTIVIMLNGKT